MKNKFVLISSGEPAGIGPDLCVYLSQLQQKFAVVVLADPELLHQRAQQLGIPVELVLLEPSQTVAAGHFSGCGQLLCLPVNLHDAVVAGQLNVKNVAYVLEQLRTASHLCQNGSFSALVTAPVHKGIINEAGIRFSGHTEYLAELSATQQVVMMLATQGLRVALATTHLPLREVADALTPALLRSVITIIHHDFQTRMGIKQPHIFICGLNPHAGEEGHLGSEEQEILIPVIEALKQQGLRLTGPLPADTIFSPENLEQADCFLAMYHDQGLPVLKYRGFGAAVNITLGLPFIRTSVDHGTALSLAGKPGVVKTGSLLYAIEEAEKYCRA